MPLKVHQALQVLHQENPVLQVQQDLHLLENQVLAVEIKKQDLQQDHHKDQLAIKQTVLKNPQASPIILKRSLES